MRLFTVTYDYGSDKVETQTVKTGGLMAPLTDILVAMEAKGWKLEHVIFIAGMNFYLIFRK